MSTLQPRKNLPVLIEAYAKIRSRIPGVKLVLAGKRTGQNFDEKIDKAVEKYSLETEVIFPGFIDETDKAGVFSLAQAFCFPSLYEGFGIPVLEAMAAGTPVVASEIPAHREIAGSSAVFFDPKNAEDLADKLWLILSDVNLRRQLASSGKKQAEKFSWTSAAEKTLAVYKSLEE